MTWHAHQQSNIGSFNNFNHQHSTTTNQEPTQHHHANANNDNDSQLQQTRLETPGVCVFISFYFKLIVYWHNNSTTTISITTTIYEMWQHQVQQTTTASQQQSMKPAQPTRSRWATTAQPPCYNRPRPPTTDHGQTRTWVEGYMMRVDKYTKMEMIIFWDQHASECFFLSSCLLILIKFEVSTI